MGMSPKQALDFLNREFSEHRFRINLADKWVGKLDSETWLMLADLMCQTYPLSYQDKRVLLVKLQAKEF